MNEKIKETKKEGSHQTKNKAATKGREKKETKRQKRNKATIRSKK